MNTTLKVCFSSLALALFGGSAFLLNRQPSSSTASPLYKSATAELTTKYKQFTDRKCLASARPQDAVRLDILRDETKVNPKGVSHRAVWVAMKVVNEEGTFYTFQIIDYRKGTCAATFSTVGDEEESNPFSRHFMVPEQALEAQLIWDKWQLENVPNWRQKTQRYLNGSKVQLAKEEYLSLQQLGFKMPEKWEEIS